MKSIFSKQAGLFLSILFLVAGSTVKSQDAGSRSTSGGMLSFSVRTVTENGTYSPKHVLAIWIEKNGVFVKSRKVMAAARKQYLYSWIASSAQNSTDAVTGATLSTHQTHTVTWNCKDLAGNVVPDGEYTIWVEYTDKHAQGPKASFPFTKGTTTIHQTVADLTYFKDITIDFVPLTAQFTASQSEFCAGTPVTFTDGSVNASSWAWNFGANAQPATATGPGPHQVVYGSAGAKTVSLTIDNAVTDVQTGMVNVLTTPTAGFTWAVNYPSVSFTNSSLDAQIFSWNFGDGSTSTDSSPVHTYLTPGTYTVALIVGNGSCSDTLVQDIVLQANLLPEMGPSSRPEAVQDPVTGQINLQWKGLPGQTVEVKIFTSTGRNLYRKVYEANGHDFFQTVPPRSKSGIVFVEITSGGQSFVRKLALR